ncbi:MAG TPA: hypothetical protein VN948_11295 [Terriglobales bacterium]|nr:hypothetical protein [Terriglobales bacterium]
MLRNGSSLRSYNDFAGRNGSGHCGDATMPRDIPRVYLGHDSNRPYAAEIVKVTLNQGSPSEFEAACAAVPH